MVEDAAPPAGGPPGIVRRLGRPLRVGGIDYLNSRPLLFGLAEALGREAEVENLVPSELARKLRAGELDVALVPVAEYFDQREDYRVIPGIAISSHGPVESVLLFHRRPLREAARVGLDRSSMSSSLLVRLLFAEAWAAGRAGPSFETLAPRDAVEEIESPDSRLDAVLLIGDAAIAARPSPAWEVVDLGTAWTSLTGLPFVAALWVYRGPEVAGLPAAFQRARDAGRSRIDEIVDRGPLPAGMTPERARRYLQQTIHHHLGPAEIEGLLDFHRRARARGLLGPGAPLVLRFLEDGAEER
jgi:chorismate dehydratase